MPTYGQNLGTSSKKLLAMRHFSPPPSTLMKAPLNEPEKEDSVSYFGQA